MWMLTIICNTLIVFGFWLAGFIAVTPAFNSFVQYTVSGEVIPLPIISSAVLSVRLPSLGIPILWLFLSIVLILRFGKKTQHERVQMIQLHTSTSVLGGLIIFVVFATAGILPFLRFGGFIE